jgi:hypothetical protein
MDYPEHEFSKYIDRDMSFDNRVESISDVPNKKSDLVYALKNIKCEGGMSLDPRYQEYLKKKKYYQDNNIKPCISLEREFMITKDDISKIKAFLKGKRDIYNPKNNWVKRDYCHPKQFFPSRDLHDDPRVPKPNKPERHKPVKNMGMFYPEGRGQFYEVKGQELDGPLDLRDVTGFDLDDTRFDPRSDPQMYPGLERQCKRESQYNVIDNRRKISTKVRRKHKKKKRRDMDELIGHNSFGVDDYMDVGSSYKVKPENVDTLRDMSDRYNKLDKSAMPYTDYMEKEKNIVVPNIVRKTTRNIRRTDYDDNFYMDPTDGYGNGDLETCLASSMPTITRKSYGFRNPSEHYYQYIDEDIQNPNNVVFPIPRGGISTRIDNTSSAKRPYSRNIM